MSFFTCLRGRGLAGVDLVVSDHHDGLVVDYERKVQTSETLIEVAMIRLLVVRLGRQL